jgi:hypothetical protein
MKNKVSLLFGLCLLTGLISAPVYAEPRGMKAKVPFEFVVGGKTLPAGEYRMIAVPHRVDIQDANGKKLAVVLANEISGGSAREYGKIIFHCYREQCFLSEVWSPDYEHGQLVSSRSEEDRVKKEIVNYVAVLGEKIDK